MNLTPVYGIPCPSSTDYASLAIYMQRLAEFIDTSIKSRRDSVANFMTPDTAIWESKSSFTFDTTGTLGLSLTAGDCIYFNYLQTPAQASLSAFSTNLPLFGLTFAPQFARSGVYHIGYQIRATATGAVTNDSARLLELGLYRMTSTTSSLITKWGRRLNAEVTVATDYLMADLVVTVTDADVLLLGVTGQFSHNNVGSTMTVDYRRAWLTRLGGLDLIEVI